MNDREINNITPKAVQKSDNICLGKKKNEHTSYHNGKNEAI